MDSREQLQQQMIEIGDCYLQRTLGELPRLREIVSALRPGGNESTLELEHISHRMHGSGAIFKFDAVSKQARRIELIAKKRMLGPADIGELGQHLAVLESVVREAALARSIELP
jgi:hypothetical protein